MNGNIPYDAGAAVDAHFVLKKKSVKPISFIAGKPLIIRNTVISTTKPITRKPHTVNINLTDFSTAFAVFLMFFIAAPYLFTGTAPALAINSSAFPFTAKSKKSCADLLNGSSFLVTKTKLR